MNRILLDVPQLTEEIVPRKRIKVNDESGQPVHDMPGPTAATTSSNAGSQVKDV